jgi:hypothetical protein
VFGVSVTNNNVFRIWWLDLLTLLLQSVLITISYSAVANVPNSQTTGTCSILVLVLFCTLLSLYSELLPTSEFASLITTLHGLNGKHRLDYWRSLFTAPLLIIWLPIVAHLSGKVFTGPLPSNGLYFCMHVCCGNAFTKSLPRNEYTRYNMLICISWHILKLIYCTDKNTSYLV